MPDVAAAYLKDREWSMGNGQCPDCCGLPPGWLSWTGHTFYREKIGHELDCKLASALRDVGGSPLMLGTYTDGPTKAEYDADPLGVVNALRGKSGLRPLTHEEWFIPVFEDHNA